MKTKIALIAPNHTGSFGNPGWHFITAGIREIFRTVDRDIEFFELNMLGPDPAWHTAKETCRLAVLCGNPRFNLDPKTVFWDWDIWQRLEYFGIPYIDAFAGAAHPWPLRSIDEMANAIRAIPKTAKILEYERRARLVIARDPLAFELLATVNENTILAPCSSWLAPPSFWFPRMSTKQTNLIVARWLGPETVPPLVQYLKTSDIPARLITTHFDCWKHFRDAAPQLPVELVTHPADVLAMIARSRNVISLRLHATIPALALGCNVADVSSDSRSLTLKPLAVPSNSLDDFLACRDLLSHHKTAAPNYSQVTNAIRETLATL